VVFSLAVGVDTLAARWYEPIPRTATHSWQLGPELRLGAGFVANARVIVSAEGYGALPFLGTPGNGEALRLGGALALGGLGVGADCFLREGGSWDLRLSARRSWARPWGFLFFPGTQIEGERPTLDVWLFEAGIGHARRRGHVDGSWIVSLLGGPLWTGGRAGWMAGLSFVRAWSRS